MARITPVSAYTNNPRFLAFRNKPVLLIASDHHYGALINRDFDYVAFFDKLKSKGQNFTRIYPGAYIEQENDYLPGNPLGARNGREILPWLKTDAEGAHPVLGGRKYDLDQWDPAYFARLRDFCAKASERGIVVEICYFNGMYEERWPFQALYHKNNIQGAGTCAWDMVQSLEGDPQLVSYHEKYVAEIARRLNDADNVLFHICDEPWQCKKDPETMGRWMDRMIDAYCRAEAPLPNRHLLGQTVDWRMRNNGADFSDDPRIRYLDIEYTRGLDDLQNEYGHKKPVVYIETNFYPDQFEGDPIAGSRVEAWEFMVGGCAGFLHLNAQYTAENPAADGTDIDKILDTFAALRAFLESFEWFNMRRDAAFLASPLPEGAHASASGEPGKQYAFYVHHSKYLDPPPSPDNGGSYRHAYTARPGKYNETFTFGFDAGNYSAEWVDPAAGAVVQREQVEHGGGTREFSVPAYSVDIALRMKRHA